VFLITKDEVDEMKKFLVAFFKDEEGLTMVEYAVAGSLVAVACVTAFTSLGTAIGNKIQDIINAVNS
jgi:pilus assembly protein Flp/PilA